VPNAENENALTLYVQVDVVEVGLVVLRVDLTLINALVFVSNVVDDKVPLVISTHWFYHHSPVADKR